MFKNIKTPDDLLNEARSARRNVLKTKRDQLTSEPINGFQVGRIEDRLNITDTANRWDSLGVETIDWILADNTTRPVTQADLQAVIDTYALRKLQVFGQYQALCEQLLVSDDPELVDFS